MAMTRLISQALTRKHHPPISSSINQHRLRSSKAHQQAHLIEVDLDSAQSETVEVGGPGVRRLEEVLQSIIAKRAAPDWLPFLPGYSYYVPPPSPTDTLIDVLGKLSNATNSRHNHNSLSLTPDRTWPSSTYFIEGTAPTHPLPMGSVVEVKLYECDEAEQESSSEEE